MVHAGELMQPQAGMASSSVDELVVNADGTMQLPNGLAGSSGDALVVHAGQLGQPEASMVSSAAPAVVVARAPGRQRVLLEGVTVDL